MNYLNIKAVKIKLVPLQNEESYFTDTYYKFCKFCEKRLKIDKSNLYLDQHFINKPFYCPFCIRNNFNNKGNRNVLIMSFRGILGHYYNLYQEGKIPFCNILDIEKAHRKAGEKNPTMHYDPETFLWFVDFNKIGCDKNKFKIETVIYSIEEILEKFNLEKFKIDENQLFEKFEKAVLLFFEKRKRPKSKRMLIPTVPSCTKEKINLEKTRFFTPNNLKIY